MVASAKVTKLADCFYKIRLRETNNREDGRHRIRNVLFTNPSYLFNGKSQFILTASFPQELHHFEVNLVAFVNATE